MGCQDIMHENSIPPLITLLDWKLSLRRGSFKGRGMSATNTAGSVCFNR